MRVATAYRQTGGHMFAVSGESRQCLNLVSLSALSVCWGVCVRRSEAGVSGEKGQVSSAADECRSYISSRPPQTPEQ